ITFLESLQEDILITEPILFNKLARIAGQADLLTYQDGIINVYDWKTNKDIITKENPYNKQMLGGLSHIPDITYYHYALQLSVYRFLLQAWGFQVGKLTLLHLTEQGCNQVEVPYLEEEAMKILSN
ncbi:MAG: hypothetical protein R3250_15820, partial [Melioribacteraceae bacterium]|nr:hypothetical protein [Melioribacteraceae bacterium]